MNTYPGQRPKPDFYKSKVEEINNFIASLTKKDLVNIDDMIKKVSDDFLFKHVTIDFESINFETKSSEMQDESNGQIFPAIYLKFKILGSGEFYYFNNYLSGKSNLFDWDPQGVVFDVTLTKPSIEEGLLLKYISEVYESINTRVRGFNDLLDQQNGSILAIAKEGIELKKNIFDSLPQ